MLHIYAKRVEELNKDLPSYNTIKYFAVLPREFTIEGGELTPTLKLKRKEIFNKYKDMIEELYVNAGNGLVGHPKTINGEEK